MYSSMLSDSINRKLLKLDIEFGNASGFFSASKCWRYDGDVWVGLKSGTIAEIPGASLVLEEGRLLCDGVLERNMRFTPEHDARLYDLVSRFVVFSDDRPATIAGMSIPHRSTNIYHQYPATEARVPIGDGGYLRFTDNASSTPQGFENVFYVRDESVERDGLRRWIVHHRMIARRDASTLVVRCCHPVFDGPVPCQGLIPKQIKQRLFRIREARHPNFPFMAVGEVLVQKAVTAEIRTKIEAIDESGQKA